MPVRTTVAIAQLVSGNPSAEQWKCGKGFSKMGKAHRYDSVVAFHWLKSPSIHFQRSSW